MVPTLLTCDTGGASWPVTLARLLRAAEDWLVARVLHYAHCRGYTRYAPTLEADWRQFIQGITRSVMAGLRFHDGAVELSPHLDLENDPSLVFGIEEARRHRERGVDLPMFMGLFKYYRQAYLDLVDRHFEGSLDHDEARTSLERLFDRIEIGFCQEWTDRSQPEVVEALQAHSRELVNEKNAYLTIFESLSSPAFLLDSECRVRNLNSEAIRLVADVDRPAQPRGSAEDVPTEIRRRPRADSHVGSHARELVPFLPPIDGLLTGGPDKDAMLELRGKVAGELRDFEVTISPMRDVSQKFQGAVVVFQDMTERHELESHLRFMATTDALTGVANRRSLLRRAEHEFDRARRYVRPLSMLMLDLDHFKLVNDTWGHFAGDEALKALCRTCVGALRSTDSFGRLGGEEFAVLMPETGTRQACEAAERFRQLVEGLSVNWHGAIIRLTVSIGAATLEPADADIFALMRRADLALYTAKDVGRNRVVLCTDTREAADVAGEQVDYVVDQV